MSGRSTAFKLPVVGPWMSRIGHVGDIFATSCTVSPEIWVYALFHGVPSLAIGLLKPTPFDLVTERFQAGHKRKRKRRYHITDVLEDKTFRVGKAGWAVFRLGEWAERLGWYMLVFDQATKLAVHWSSMAYQWSGCRVAGEPYGEVAMDKQLLNVNNHTVNGLWSTVVSKGGFYGSPNGVICNPGYTATPCLELTMEPPGGIYPPASHWSFQLFDALGTWSSPPIDLAMQGAHYRYGRYLFKDWNYGGPGRYYQTRTTAGDGFIRASGTLKVIGFKDDPLIGDP